MLEFIFALLLHLSTNLECNITILADAITQFENTAPELNNPGALIYAGQPGAKETSKSKFAQFDSPEAGRKALEKQLRAAILGYSRIYNPDMTIQEFIEVYANTSPNQELETYGAFLRSRLGVKRGTTLKALR